MRKVATKVFKTVKLDFFLNWLKDKHSAVFRLAFRHRGRWCDAITDYSIVSSMVSIHTMLVLTSTGLFLLCLLVTVLLKINDVGSNNVCNRSQMTNAMHLILW